MEDHREKLINQQAEAAKQEDDQLQDNQSINKSWASSTEEVEEILGYKFKDPSLLHQAFTHSSYQEEENCGSYERLEYMGDAVLNLLIAKEHYFLYPHLSPGKLTRLRSVNVDNEKLARAAIKHNFYKYLRHHKPLLTGQIEEFKEAITHYPIHSSGLVDAPKVLADIVESIIGAIYIDCDFSMEKTWQLVKNLLQPIITPASLPTHPVTKVYEICQKNGLKVEFVDLWKETGEFEVFVNDEFAGRGQYHAKRLVAHNRAANNAYNQILRKLAAAERMEEDKEHENHHLYLPFLDLVEKKPSSRKFS